MNCTYCRHDAEQAFRVVEDDGSSYLLKFCTLHRWEYAPTIVKKRKEGEMVKIPLAEAVMEWVSKQ